MKQHLKELSLGVAPVFILISILHFTITPVGAELYFKFILSSIFVILGVSIFLYGINVALIPLGKDISSTLVQKGNVKLLLIFGLIIGFAVTVLEPAVLAIIEQLPNNFPFSKNVVLYVTAISVGVFILLSFLTILFKIPIRHTLSVVYGLIIILLILADEQIRSIAVDVGTLTTGSLTVPFFIALGSGIAAVTAKDSEAQSSFGVVALSSLGPIIAILILGVISRWL
ncbi:MAG TPA: DUF1538 domain-containing protein [Bacilli bacterium]|nr:DUF1538 domain-containing protein [Bacilli bacterium]